MPRRPDAEQDIDCGLEFNSIEKVSFGELYFPVLPFQYGNAYISKIPLIVTGAGELDQTIIDQLQNADAPVTSSPRSVSSSQCSEASLVFEALEDNENGEQEKRDEDSEVDTIHGNNDDADAVIDLEGMNIDDGDRYLDEEDAGSLDDFIANSSDEDEEEERTKTVNKRPKKRLLRKGRQDSSESGSSSNSDGGGEDDIHSRTSADGQEKETSASVVGDQFDDDAGSVMSLMDVNINGAIENEIGRIESCYYLTMPMSCLIPCPSSLRDQDTQGYFDGATYTTRLLMLIVKIIEENFFYEERVKIRARQLRRNNNRNNNSQENEDGTDSDHNDQFPEGEMLMAAGEVQEPEFRFYMEYIISDKVQSAKGDFMDVGLIEIAAIRFRLVAYNESARLEDALDFYFKTKLKESQKKSAFRRTGPQLSHVPSILLQDQDIKSWQDFANCALAYYGGGMTNSVVNLRNISTRGSVNTGLPNNSVLHPGNLFSEMTSLKIVKDQLQDGTDVHPLQRNAIMPNVGIPSLMYEFLSTWINRVSIMYCILPRSIHSHSASIRHMVSSSMVMPFLKNLNDSRVRSVFERDIKFDRKQANDVADLAELFNAKIHQIYDNAASSEQRIELLDAFRRETLNQHSRIWSTSANISPSSILLIRAARKMKTWTTPPKYYQYMDTKHLSSFGNMISTDFYNLEFSLGYATTHRVFYQAYVCAMNAYHYKLNSLHLNMLMLGAGASGKSFILDTLSAVLVKDSVQKVTHMTNKALAGEENDNDHITVFHELPGELLDSKSNGKANNNTGDPILKDALTSGSVTSHTMTITEDKKRKPVITRAEKVGVYICATNERVDRMHEALRTRFLLAYVNENARPGSEVIDKQRSVVSFGQDKTRIDHKMDIDRFKQRIQRRQVMCLMVERMIATGTIDDVDLSAVEAGFSKALQYIKAEHTSSRGAPREYSSLRAFARTMTILHACERYANSTQSPGYGKRISFHNLYEIRRYLFCTQEIAIFTLSMFFDEFAKVNTIHVMNILLHAMGKFWAVDELSGDIIEENGYYVTRPVFKSTFDIHREMSVAQSDPKITKRFSLENLQVTFHELQNMKVPGTESSVIKFTNKTDQVLYVSKTYIQKYFNEERVPEELATAEEPMLKCFQLRFDLMNIFKLTVKHAFSHAGQKVQKNAILSFPKDPKVPFILQTMDLGVDKKASDYIDTSQYYSIANQSRHPQGKWLYGKKVFIKGPHAMIRCDYQDVRLTEFLVRNRVIRQMRRTSQSVVDTQESLNKVFASRKSQVLVSSLPQRNYPEGLLNQYKNVYSIHDFLEDFANIESMTADIDLQEKRASELREIAIQRNNGIASQDDDYYIVQAAEDVRRSRLAQRSVSDSSVPSRVAEAHRASSRGSPPKRVRRSEVLDETLSIDEE